MTKGYKATHNYKCINQTYEIGKKYKLNKMPIICEQGFHYCLNPKNTLEYYSYNYQFKLLEIEDLNPNDSITSGNKSCSNHIKIVREITDPEELFQLLGCIKTFNTQGNILTHKDSTGYFSEYTYDKNGNELTYKTSDGFWRVRTYDESGNKLTFKDSDNYWRERTYDSNGNELTFKNSQGYWYEYTYDEFGRQLTFKDSYDSESN